jgi:hypothetical protein
MNNTITTSQTLKYATYNIERLFTDDVEFIVAYITVDIKDEAVKKIYMDTIKTEAEYEESVQVWIDATEQRLRMMSVLTPHVEEMEGYSYYGANPGISAYNLEDIVEEIIKEFKII